MSNSLWSIALEWWPLWATVGLVAMALLAMQRLKKMRRVRQERAARMRRKRQETAMPPRATGLPIMPSPPVPMDAPTRRPLILLVDDSPAALAFAERILQSQPYRLHLAANGRQAWAFLQDHKPDLIVSDIDMPHMNGFQLLRLVREDLKLADVPFMLVTSHLQEHVVASQNAGFDSLLPKPYAPDDLLQQVGYLLRA